MPFTWRYETLDGSAVSVEGLSKERFPTQADAETWIGESWQDLVERGVDQVSLLEGDRVVYGPMSLHAVE